MNLNEQTHDYLDSIVDYSRDYNIDYFGFNLFSYFCVLPILLSDPIPSGNLAVVSCTGFRCASSSSTCSSFSLSLIICLRRRPRFYCFY